MALEDLTDGEWAALFEAVNEPASWFEDLTEAEWAELLALNEPAGGAPAE
jgi:diadenosine tetraphosphate (Ap4A) HIT family hydrolase